ncbi:MAG: M48 family metallopeptidase [Nannocystis sp.]|nr:M48 family metallopeptidase [Nannocystis sp.]
MDAVSTVAWGTTRIDYVLRRSARQKTLSIRVEPDGSVEVVAPEGADAERVAAVVRGKAKWIVDRRRQAEAMPPPPAPREFVSGETFMYRGRQYRLRVTAGAEAGAEASVKLVAGHLEVTLPRGTSAAERPGVVRGLLVAWYRARAAEKLPGWVAVWAEKVGVQPRAVMIRDQKKRWGSCDAKGNLRFNWRVVQLPTRLVDYVVAHEVVHLVVPEHGEEFWSQLGRLMPDADTRRVALACGGGGAVW